MGDSAQRISSWNPNDTPSTEMRFFFQGLGIDARESLMYVRESPVLFR